MDWDHAIKRNSEVLAGIVDDLFLMLGLVGDATVSRISWPAYRAVLRVLRPAESALRRLIVVAARGLVVAPAVSRPKSRGRKNQEGGTLRSLLPAFRSADPDRAAAPQKSQAGCRPHPLFQYRWRVYNHRAAGAAGKNSARTKSADGMVNAARVIRRLEALEAALPDLPRQAKRLVRWRMREEKSENPNFKTPLRPGRPPGSRRRAVHLVDELLSECDWLAFRATMPDTS